MADRTLEIVISASDATSGAFASVERGLNGVGNKAASMASQITSAWVGILAVVGSATWLLSAKQQALDAEIAFNKLKIQVEGLGLKYKEQEPIISAAISKASEYAIVQEEHVARTLQQLIFYSGDYAGSLKNLNLVYDMAYLKGIDVAEAGTAVGKAMNGNLERLGRMFPELRIASEEWGKFATTQEKAAYAQHFMTVKTNEALEKMTENEKRAKSMTKAYDDFMQTIGGAGTRILTGLASIFYETAGAVLKLTGALINAASYLVFASAESNLRKLSKEFSGAGDEVRAMALKMANAAAGIDEIEKKSSTSGEKAVTALKAEENALRKKAEARQAAALTEMAHAELNKKISEETKTLEKETHKLSLTEEQYGEWQAKNLISQGAELSLIKGLTVATAANFAEKQKHKQEKDLPKLADSQLKLADTQARLELESLKRAQRLEAEVLDNAYKNKLISAEKYFAKKEARAIVSSAAQKTLLDAEIMNEQSAYVSKSNALQSTKASQAEQDALMTDYATKLFELNDKKMAADSAYTLDMEKNRQSRREADSTELQEQKTNDEIRGMLKTSAANITGAANKAMETQMLKLVETGKFSAAAFAQIIVQQVKMELIGIAAKAAIYALYETAVGLAASTGAWGLATFGNPAGHFASAAVFAGIAAGALGAAMGVQAAFGGMSSESGSSSSTASTGGGGTGTYSATPAGFPIAPDKQAAPTQYVTINFQNAIGDEAYFQKITEDNIIPAINAAADRNIAVRVVYA